MDDLEFKLSISDNNMDTTECVLSEVLNDCYRLRDVEFKEGDIIVDIGAHVGIFSMYMAKRWPGVKIVALEPIPGTYFNLFRNIYANHFQGQIIPINVGVSDEFGFKTFQYNPLNSGASSMYVKDVRDYLPMVGMVAPLSHVLDHVGPRIALLKMDCEGAEHQALHNLPVEYFKRIGRFRAEIHLNDYLRSLGFSYQRIAKLLCENIPDVLLTPCEMGQ